MSSAPLILNPDLLPKNESHVLAPQFRGVSGSATFTFRQTPETLDFNVKAQLGMFLFKNALNFEARCQWKKSQGQWTLVDYIEINHKNDKQKSSEEGLNKAYAKYPGQMILGPISLLYALRTQPLKDVGESRIGYACRGDNPISVEIIAKERGEKRVKGFGQNRKLLRLEALIESPKSSKKISVFSDGKAALWIDQETNLIVEVGYEVPPFGTLSMALEKVS